MKATWISGSDIDHKEWDAFVEQSPQGMFYSLTGYMNIVAPGWSAIEVRNDGKLCGVMPLHIRSKAGIKYSLQPYYTQYWGPILSDFSSLSTYKRNSEARKIMIAMMEQLPASLKLISHGCAPALDYGSPLHWAGFELRTRYSMRLTPEPDEEKRLASFAPNTRQDIKKGSQWTDSIIENGTPAAFLKLVDKNLAAGKPLMPAVCRVTAEKLLPWLIHTGLGHILLVQPPGQDPIAGTVIVKYRNTLNYPIGASDPSGNNSDAISLLLWQSIRKADRENLVFDFEGSMIQTIDSFFRGFGAEPVPYLHIYRNRLPLFLRWIRK
jgi:hypothetical protein